MNQVKLECYSRDQKLNIFIINFELDDYYYFLYLKFSVGCH